MQDDSSLRRCSRCRLPGHTKRSCGISGKATQTPPSRANNEPVFVRVVPEHAAPSQHVVELRSREQHPLQKVSAYQEFREKTNAQRDVLDIAAIIRQAQEREQKKWAHTSSVSKKVSSPRVVSAAPTLRPIKKIRTTPRFIKSIASFPSAMADRTATGMRQRVENIKTRAKKHSVRTLAIRAVAILVLATLPLPTIAYYHSVSATTARVADSANHGFLSLQASTVAAMNADLDGAQSDLNDALKFFSEANTVIEQDHRALQYVGSLLPIVGKHVRSREAALTAGQHLTLGNTYILKGIREASDETSDMPVTDRMEILKNHIAFSLPQYRAAQEDLMRVDLEALPPEYQSSFEQFRLLFATFINDMENLNELMGALHTVLGSDQLQRYLVVMQNNAELRATGGFMGSFALVDVQKGKIVNVEVPGGGTYDLQGQLGVYLTPPTPLQVLNGRWEFQDANWWPDFPASAKKTAWFYEQAGGRTVDGVIAVNASVFERFLRIAGPFTNEAFADPLTADTALTSIQEKVEDDNTNEPKKVIAVLLEQLIGGMRDIEPKKLLQLIGELQDAATQKEIQVFFMNQKTEERFRGFGWTGELLTPQSDQDYLAVVHTNLQGQKSDRCVKQAVTHQAHVQDDGSIINTVVIKKKHTCESGERFYGTLNIDYVRMYVPEGAELLDAQGFTYPPEESFQVPEQWYTDDVDLSHYERGHRVHIESGTDVYESFGKTVFGNWMVTPPGGETEVFFVYRLPFSIAMNPHIKTDESQTPLWQRVLRGSEPTEASRYSLILQKQSGVTSDFESRVIYPDDWQPISRSSDDVVLAKNGAMFETTLLHDTVFGVVMERTQK